MPRTNKNNIRLVAFGRAQVIWNWEVNPSELRVHRSDNSVATAGVSPLAANTWYNLKWRITQHGTVIYVNDGIVFHEARVNGYSGGPSSDVWIESGDGSVVDVRSFEITSAKAGAAKPTSSSRQQAGSRKVRRGPIAPKKKLLYHVWEWQNPDFKPFKLKLFLDGSACRFNEDKPTPGLTWERHGGSFVLHWPGGYYDALNVSGDGREMNGANQNRTQIRAVYIGTNLNQR